MDTINGRDFGVYVDEMANGYLAAALFTADEEVGIPHISGEFRDRGDFPSLMARFPKAVRAYAAKICADFAAANAADLTTYAADDAGMDLWYTRCGHGCGFWEADHCTREEGERLTTAAERLGEPNLVKIRGGWFWIDDWDGSAMRCKR